MTRCAGDGYGRVLPAGARRGFPPGEDTARGPAEGSVVRAAAARCRVRQRMWRPEIARAMTRRWISLVPSKMV